MSRKSIAVVLGCRIVIDRLPYRRTSQCPPEMHARRPLVSTPVLLHTTCHVCVLPYSAYMYHSSPESLSDREFNRPFEFTDWPMLFLWRPQGSEQSW